MKIITFATEDYVKTQRGSLSSDIASGSSAVISMYNASGFSIDDYVVIGFEGSENAELVQITAVTETSITATLNLSHKQDEPVTTYLFNERKVYGSLTLAGAYTELASYGSPYAITPNNPQGVIVEYDGIEGYVYFKATYFNSDALIETDITDAVAFFANDSLRYCTLYAIRKQANLTNNPYVTDTMLENYRKRAENEIKSYIMTRYTLPLQRVDGTLEVPAIVENCATLLAAGYVDYQEFGKDGQGIKWLGEARSILKSIKTGTQRLLDSTDQEMAYISTSNQVQGYPIDVDNCDQGGAQRKFTMNQIF